MSLFAGNDWIRSPLDLITSQGSASGAAVAVASVAAITAASLSNGQWNVCKRVQITLAVSSSASQAPYQFFLFNSSNSNGTALWGWTVSPQNAAESSLFTAGNIPQVEEDDLHIATPVAGQALCLSGSGNMSAGVVANVLMQSYVLGKQPATVSMLS